VIRVYKLALSGETLRFSTPLVVLLRISKLEPDAHGGILLSPLFNFAQNSLSELQHFGVLFLLHSIRKLEKSWSKFVRLVWWCQEFGLNCFPLGIYFGFGSLLVGTRLPFGLIPIVRLKMFQAPTGEALPGTLGRSWLPA
jgi:hypothetical protein